VSPRLAAAGIALLSTACRNSGDSETAAPEAGVAVTPQTSAAPAVDHLGPDELLEGTQVILGLHLPRALSMTRSDLGNAYATGMAGIHPLVEYFRARLSGGAVREGKDAATFEHAHVRGTAPGTEVSVEIKTVPAGALVEVHNTTPPPPSNLPDEAARWKAVGMTPDGKIADPAHLD
jgi:hypothetical protein